MYQKQGCVTISELVNILGVSTETIRRDLLFLEKENALQCVHGGAVAVNSSKKFSSFPQRLNENIQQKRQLSMIRAKFIH